MAICSWLIFKEGKTANEVINNIRNIDNKRLLRYFLKIDVNFLQRSWQKNHKELNSNYLKNVRILFY